MHLHTVVALPVAVAAAFVEACQMSEERELTGRERRMQNLRPFTPGDPRINREGRPRQIFSKGLRSVLEGEREGGKSDREELQQLIIDVALGRKQATPTQMRAIEFIADRLEGRPRQSISVDTDERERRERKLQNFLAESEREGDPLTREQAIAILGEEDSGFEDFE
ncbi:MAG: hypothetical protein ACJ754_01625 [Pyrinomonadaceae bacterium]